MSFWAGIESIDIAILQFVNGFSNHSAFLDGLVYRIAYDENFKGVIIMALAWAAWFWAARLGPETRERIIGTLVAGVVAVGVAKLLALTLPYRDRPIHDIREIAMVPLGMSPGTLSGWSSFPSDHATMFFALAVGLLLASRTIGIIAIIHATLIVSLPRIFLGLHYPGDILGGAVLGTSIALLVVPIVSRVLVRVNALQWAEQWSFASMAGCSS